MPNLIKAGRVVEADWQPVDRDAVVAGGQDVLSLDQWLDEPDKEGRSILIEPGQAPSPLFDHLDGIPMVAIYFPVFTDGRGFSYARELRERGYAGELRACGHIIRDQLSYLARCGFDAFQLQDGVAAEDAVTSLEDFNEHYQAAIDQPLPLFRRRSS